MPHPCGSGAPCRDKGPSLPGQLYLCIISLLEEFFLIPNLSFSWGSHWRSYSCRWRKKGCSCTPGATQAGTHRRALLLTLEIASWDLQPGVDDLSTGHLKEPIREADSSGRVPSRESDLAVHPPLRSQNGTNDDERCNAGDKSTSVHQCFLSGWHFGWQIFHRFRFPSLRPCWAYGCSSLCSLEPALKVILVNFKQAAEVIKMKNNWTLVWRRGVTMAVPKHPWRGGEGAAAARTWLSAQRGNSHSSPPLSNSGAQTELPDHISWISLLPG